jgi:putative membrane protein
MSNATERSLIVAFVTLVALLVISGLHPFDQTTWVLEVFPIFVVLPLLLATHKRFPLTPLLYCLIFVHAIVLMVGGTYSYARVPIGFYFQDFFQLGRNPYDKVGHFFQGLVPALAIREVLLRSNCIAKGKMLIFLILFTVLGISAMYELLEWFSALVLGQGADEFLGTQGDPWDTQSDMLFAFIGATTSLLGFSVLHDRQILQSKPPV